MPIKEIFSRLHLLLRSLALITLVGCGSGGVRTYPVSGTVTFSDGTPLAGGLVQFRSVTGEHRVGARGPIQQDGSYQLGTFEFDDGVVEGDHEVLVTPPPFQGDRDEIRYIPEIIHRKHSSFTTSGLRYTVSTDGGDNQFDIIVERPAR
jgi:hypothetical protein